jgi:hypothetical protein
MPRQHDPTETRAEALRDALDESIRRDPIHHRRDERTANMDRSNDNEGAVPLMRMVDMRIPLPWLLGGFALAAAGVIGMYYQLQSVAQQLGELKVTVAASNSQAMAMAGEVALLRFKVEQHDKDIERMKEARK